LEDVRKGRVRGPFKTVDEMIDSLEVGELNRSQIATGSQKHRDPRFPPYAFTEHGAVMLASVLNSTVAVEASIVVFEAIRQLMSPELPEPPRRPFGFVGGGEK
jgi:hypothetical protein